MSAIHFTFHLTAFLMDYRALWIKKKEGFEPKFWKVFPNQSHAKCLLVRTDGWCRSHSSIPDLWGYLFHQMMNQSLNNVLERIRNLLEKPPSSPLHAAALETHMGKIRSVFLKSNVVAPEAFTHSDNPTNPLKPDQLDLKQFAGSFWLHLQRRRGGSRPGCAWWSWGFSAGRCWWCSPALGSSWWPPSGTARWTCNSAKSRKTRWELLAFPTCREASGKEHTRPEIALLMPFC